MFFDTRKPLLWIFFAAILMVSFGPTLAKVLEKRPLKSAPLSKLETSVEIEKESSEKDDFSESFDWDLSFPIDSLKFEFIKTTLGFENLIIIHKNSYLGYFLRAPPFIQ